MVETVYKNKTSLVLQILLYAILVIPVISCACFLVNYLIGPFRPASIKAYNKNAKLWVDGGETEFTGQDFYFKGAGVESKIAVITQGGTCYPVRDKCNLKGDPAEGCVYTSPRYYRLLELFISSGITPVQIRNGTQEIIKMNIPFSKNITKSPSDLGCSTRLEDCPNICDELNGIWSPFDKICLIPYFINKMCIRLENTGDKWVPEHGVKLKYENNKKYLIKDTDMMGCDYGNNWNSAVYKATPPKSDTVEIELRSYKDAAIAASAFTLSCSNDYSENHYCFGLTQTQLRGTAILGMFISGGIFVVALWIFVIVKLLGKLQTVNKDTHSKLVDNV